MLKKIRTSADVAKFAKQLIQEGVSFHPDDDFTNYVSLENGEPAYSDEEATLRNRLMSECFTACEKENSDIYNIMLEVTLLETGMDQIIPLPSQELAEA